MGKADKAGDQSRKRIDAIQKLGEDQGTQDLMQPQSHTFLQGEETMLSKAWSIVALTVAALGLFTASAQARVRAAGTHHTTSHGSHYSAGHGASHKSGSY
ncbi:hypothetical protein [Xanthomonas axonopodis]